MAKIIVARPFKLNLEDGTTLEFATGEQNVKKEIADHWYVKANLVGADADLAPVPGSFEYAQAQRRTMDEAQAVQDAQAAAAATAAEEVRKTNEAALMQKTSQAIAQGAIQAEAFAKKDDAIEMAAVSDLPNPLAASAPAADASDVASETDTPAVVDEPAAEGTGSAKTEGTAE